MKIFLKYASRNIMKKKGRSILIIISLMIASCVLILNLTIPKQIVVANENKMRDIVGSSDILIYKYDLFNIDEVNKKNDEVNYVGVNQNAIIHKDKTMMLYGTNIKNASKQKLIEDIDLGDDEIIISEEAANKYNYKVNDIIRIDLYGNTYELKVKSILNNKGLLYFKSLSGVLNENTFNKIYNTPSDKYMTYYLDLIDDENIESYNKYLKENNKEIITNELVDKEKIEDDNSYVKLILMIIFIMAVIMIFFVVSTLNKMIVMERTPVIATFRSIGATKTKMNLILILENALYGLIGGVVGSILSLLICNYSVSLLLGGDEINTTVPMSNLVIGIIFSILLEIIMSIGAILKSNKYSIKELMFDKPSSKYKLNLKEIILSIGCILTSLLLYYFTDDKNIIIDLLKITLFWIGIANAIPLILRIISGMLSFISKRLNKGSLIIGSKNLGFNKMIISSCRLVVISIAIMLVILNVSSAFDGMLNAFSYQFKGYDIFVRDLTKVDSEYTFLSDLDEVEKIDYVYMTTSENVKNYDKKLTTPPIILGMKRSRPDIEELDYKIKDLKTDEALVDEIYLNDNNWKIGDKIKLKIDGYPNTHEFKIVGTVNSFYQSVQREIIVINEEYFKANLTRVPFQLTIAVKSSTDNDEFIKKLEKELKDPDITIMTVDMFVDNQRDNIHTIMYLFYIIIGLALVLAFVGIINNQIISFMERTRELAVLNSICMSKHQLNKMLIIENLTTNIVASLVGFFVALMSVNLMNSVLNGIKMFINLKFDFKVACMFIGPMLIILILTVIIPINKLRKINIVETIKYE